MGINDWKSLLIGYLRDSGHKNPKALMSRHKDLLNYFYIKKLPPEEVNLFFGNKMENLSAAEYLKILRSQRSSQKPSYSDSMVFYKGKALGRCPAGTTRSGKTCVPAASPANSAAKYKTQDIGGLTPQQVRALSKAKTTQDVLNAHKKQN